MVIFIPSSVAICERRFSKQNAIKSHLRNRLNLKTLDALMRFSLYGLEVNAMDCNGLSSSTFGEIVCLNYNLPILSVCMFDKFHLMFNFKSKVSRDVFKNKNERQQCVCLTNFIWRSIQFQFRVLRNCINSARWYLVLFSWSTPIMDTFHFQNVMFTSFNYCLDSCSDYDLATFNEWTAVFHHLKVFWIRLG